MSASEKQQLQWLTTAAKVMARRHPSLEWGDLLGDMVVSLGGDTSTVTSASVALLIARRRVVDWQRSVLGRGEGLRPERAPSYDIDSVAVKSEDAPADESVDLSVLCPEDQLIVRRRAEGVPIADIARELGWRVTRRANGDSCSKVCVRYQRALRRLEGARVAARRKEARRGK